MGNQEKPATQDKTPKAIQYVQDTTTHNQQQQTQLRHVPSYKQLEEKTNLISLLCGNRNRHHNMELRT